MRKIQVGDKVKGVKGFNWGKVMVVAEIRKSYHGGTLYIMETGQFLTLSEIELYS